MPNSSGASKGEATRRPAVLKEMGVGQTKKRRSTSLTAVVHRTPVRGSGVQRRKQDQKEAVARKGKEDH